MSVRHLGTMRLIARIQRERAEKAEARVAELAAALERSREVARDDGRELNLADALADVFAICDMALNPENYVD